MKSAIRKLALPIAVIVGVIALMSKSETASSTGGSGRTTTESTDDDKYLRFGKRTFRISVIAQLLAAGGLLFSAQQISKATTQIELSQVQLDNSRYQDVYARQLDFEKIAIEKRDLAPYLLGGVSRNDLKPASANDEAALYAALSYALDFYNYIYTQIYHTTPELALRNWAISKPQDMSDGDWEAWRTWSETIAAGFRGAPDLCEHQMRTWTPIPSTSSALLSTQGRAPLCAYRQIPAEDPYSHATRLIRLTTGIQSPLRRLTSELAERLTRTGRKLK